MKYWKKDLSFHVEGQKHFKPTLAKLKSVISLFTPSNKFQIFEFLIYKVHFRSKYITQKNLVV